MGFMVDRVWQWEMFVSKQSGFPLSLSLHQCSILFIIVTLFLSEGQADKAWEPSKRTLLFCILRVDWTEKYFLM